MNSYRKLQDKQQKEMNAFPIGAAFSDKQFTEMMSGWGLTVDDTDKICSLGAGCFIRRADKDAFLEMAKRHTKEMQDAITADKTGDGFIYDMFIYELANHEYCITYDLTDTLDALNLTAEQVNEDKRLLHGLNKAVKEYVKNSDNY